MADDLDPLKSLHEASFVEGQRAVAKDVAARRFEEKLRTLGKVGQAAAETLDQADRLAQGGDPHKRKLATLIKESVVGAVDEMTTGRPSAEEAREAVQASPLLESSGPSATSLPSSTPKELENTPVEPPKRGRGRPPKNPKG
jgi:hypothetical protein